MFFFHNLSQDEITFLIHEFTQPEASICFINSGDTLLSIDFSSYAGGISINQNISGTNLTNPPFFKLDIFTISKIIVKYKKTREILELHLIHETTPNLNSCKKFNVKNFNHNLVVSIDLRLSVLNNGVNFTDSIYQEFISDCIHLSSFKKIEDVFRTKRLIKAKFVDTLLEESSRNLQERKKGIKKIGLNVNHILQMEKKGVTDKISSIVESDDINHTEKIYLFPEHQESHGVTLDRTGKLYHGDNYGKWLYKNNRLLLLLGGKSIQLLVNQNMIRDTNELRWYTSDPKVDISKFIQKYGDHPKLIILVITCYKRLELAKKINETWINDFRKIGILCFFVVGNTNQAHTTLKGDFLFVKAPDSYEALPAKVFQAFRYCYENFNFSHVYKIDDDTVVNPIKLLQLKLDTHDYIGKPQQVTRDFNRYWHRNKCQNKNLEKIPYPSQRIRLGAIYAKGEAGYFLSRHAIDKLLPYGDYICSDLYEDKVIGDVLSKNNIKLNILSDYTTKLYENFDASKRLDDFCVIMDVGNNIKKIYHQHLQHKIG